MDLPRSWDRARGAATGKPSQTPPRVAADALLQGRLLSDLDAATLRGGPQVPLSQPPPLHLNLLAVGDSALGKSSFLYNTAIRFGASPGQLSPCVGEGATLSDFRQQPDLMCTAVPDIALPSAQRTLKLRLQDTPGYGDTLIPGDHLRATLQWLLQQQSLDYQWAAGANALVRQPGSLGVLPHATTLCLFFVPPHRMRPVDLEYLAALNRVVPVLPVMAKADCHTLEELDEHRRRIIAALDGRRNPKGQPEPVDTFRFTNHALREGLQLQLTPEDPERLRVFSVVSSRQLQPLEGPQAGSCGGGDGGEGSRTGAAGVGAGPLCWVPVRPYPWGVVCALQRSHSDTVLLQRLLTEDVWTLMAEACQGRTWGRRTATGSGRKRRLALRCTTFASVFGLLRAIRGGGPEPGPHAGGRGGALRGGPASGPRRGAAVEAASRGPASAPLRRFEAVPACTPTCTPTTANPSAAPPEDTPRNDPACTAGAPGRPPGGLSGLVADGGVGGRNSSNTNRNAAKPAADDNSLRDFGPRLHPLFGAGADTVLARRQPPAEYACEAPIDDVEVDQQCEWEMAGLVETTVSQWERVVAARNGKKAKGKAAKNAAKAALHGW